MAIVATISALLLCGATLSAQNWPQWRGPNRDGAILAFTEPAAWPAQLKQKWQVKVGIGHASPLLVDKRVYVLARQGEEEVVACLEFATGKQIWRDAYPAPYTLNSIAAAHGKGPKSTPLFHAGKLITLGISGILSGYDAASGKILWRRNFSTDFRASSPEFGAATSPVADGNRVIAHVGGQGNGALMAFDAESGKTVWSWTGDGPAYASPIIVTLSGTRQIVTQSQQRLIGLSAADGKLLWSIPFTTSYEQNIITPILYKDILIFSGLDKGVIALRVAQDAGAWRTEKVWENPGVAFYMSNPVLNGAVLFGMSHRNKGQFVALDAATGKTLWASTGRAGENAAVLTAGDKLFLLTTDAELIVAKASGTAFEQIRRYTVAKSPTWAQPLIAEKTILVKDVDALTSWGLE
jgi:outer membrane protein assembly factor BamB